MSYNRRDFLKTSAAASALVVVTPHSAIASGRLPTRWIETEADELMAAALGAARAAGATYADVRIGRYRSQNIGTRERQITGVSDSESYGMGIRTIVNGAWGFAATNVMTTDGVAKVAREAARLTGLHTATLYRWARERRLRRFRAFGSAAQKFARAELVAFVQK